MDWEKVNAAFAASRSPNAKLAQEIHRIQRFFGLRVHEAVKVVAGDLKFSSGSDTVTAYINGKGGYERFNDTSDKTTVEMLWERARGKKDGVPIIPIKNKARK